MASLRAERAAGGPRLPATRAGRPAALRLLLLLGAVLKPQESLAQVPPTESSLKPEGVYPPRLWDGDLGQRGEPEDKMESYERTIQICWQSYKEEMDSIPKDWCDWDMISRPYSDLQYCLEHFAEEFHLGFPNPWAEEIIFETHQIHFANCSLVQPTLSDPPEDVLLAMIIAPICLIPFLVTLVVWRSKDSEAQA
ncbi:receptor activity-modifying protein 2 [Mustela nigripes]|uniref:Receptor activity-modifying protein 2 n=2 Tax=Mustela putorius furo TaxID=9669 RepID=M3YFF1_MUSPF|nr:receptor activity-modifying protein 2 isoform X1 [Mustela putorius furo]XP_032176561.1 receptor activity-modifying protein 2 isoform X2 [Mustela erminea]XP_059003760.1 receptor activity-modifying protein 2 isoform X1 [Mustela lutreola]XP_059235237.1 receptor activity-modifying protein 2 [Mustela nigripes]